MARRVPGPPGGRAYDYVPRALNNRDDPEPIVVEIQNPTERERRKLVSAARDTLEIKGGKVVVDPDGADSIQERAIRGHVVRLKGGPYLAADGSVIDTAEALLDKGELDLVSEIASVILRPLALEEPEKKISSRPSGSRPEPIPASPGTAATAGRGASIASVDAGPIPGPREGFGT